MRTKVTRPVTSTLPAATGATVMVTTDGALVPLPSLTVRLKVRGVLLATVGAVNVGFTVSAPVSVTVGVPPGCVHAYCSVSPSGSTLASPDRSTVEPEKTVRLTPALAVETAETATEALAVGEFPPAPEHTME